jgi:hypothetical protein
MKMSNKKHRIIHVDKLIVHADDVIIIPKRRPFDPWLGRRQDIEDVENVENIYDEATATEEQERDEQERPPFSWI